MYNIWRDRVAVSFVHLPFYYTIYTNGRRPLKYEMYKMSTFNLRTSCVCTLYIILFFLQIFTNFYKLFQRNQKYQKKEEEKEVQVH